MSASGSRCCTPNEPSVAGGLFSNWRAEWRQRRQAVAYTATLREELAEDDVQWLGAVALQGDMDRARWELRYARMALGLLAAERDALDDRTAIPCCQGDCRRAAHGSARRGANGESRRAAVQRAFES